MKEFYAMQNIKQIIHTKDAPAAIGPYSQAVVSSSTGLIFMSGQVPLDPQTGQLVADDLDAQTHQVMRNMAAVLHQAKRTFADVLKTTIYLTDMAHFAAVNKIYAEYFSAPYPARVTIAVHQLPCAALVEIEAIVAAAA